MGQGLGRKGDALRNMMGRSTVVEYLTQYASDSSFSVSETRLTKEFNHQFVQKYALGFFLVDFRTLFLDLCFCNSASCKVKRRVQSEICRV